MADEKKIISEVSEAVINLTGVFQALQGVINTNLQQQGQLIQYMNELKKAIGSCQELRDFVKVSADLQKQQQALSETQQAAIKLQAEQEKLRQQELKTNQSVANALKAEEQHKQALIRTEEASARQKARLNKEAEKAAKASQLASSAYQRESQRLLALTKSAKDAAIQYGVNSKQARALRTEQQKLDKQIKQVDSSLGIHNRNVGNYSSALKGVGSRLMGAFGIVGGIQMFANAIKGAAKLIKDYESANAELAGVLGVSYKETGMLRKASQDLGKTTKFTAKDVTELQVSLARMGKTEQEIIEMSEGIVLGTIAMRSETGETAELVAATLNAYQLQASKSGHVTDVLTAATQRSALSFEKLNTALPIVSGAAAAAGYSLEQTVAMLGQAADRGIDASTSATSLRNIFLELSKQGITLDEALNKINKSQDKLSAANELFGKRAAVTALALADTTMKTKDLTIALENAGGTAARVAETEMSTLEGRLDELSSAYEGLILSISSGQTSLGQFVNDAIDTITKLLLWLQENEDDFQIEMYTDETRKKTQSELEWEKKALEKHIETTTSMYNEYMLARAASINTFQRKAAFLLKPDDYDILPEGFTGNMLTYLTKMQGEYNKLVEVKGKLAIVNKALNGTLEDEEDLTKEIVTTTAEEVSVETDLIKIQEALLKQAREMPGATELDIAVRNKRIATIEKEIQRLKELGSMPKSVAEMNVEDMVKSAEDSFKALEELDQKEIDAYLDKEQKKTDILRDFAEQRKELEQRASEAASTFAQASVNAIFEVKNEQYQKDLEENAKYYDSLLANELLDEEQRSLIEAQRTERENQIMEQQRENEKKQFLFSQAFKVGEILMDSMQKIAAIQATASVLASNPVTAALAPMALAQIPIVKLTSGLSIATVLAQSIPKFAKGTDSSPEGLAWVGEKGTELKVSPDGRAELTPGKPTLDYLERGTKIVPHHELMDAVSNYSAASIINDGGMVSSQDALIAAALMELKKENKANNEKLIKALSRPGAVNKSIDRMRSENLKNKIKGQSLYGNI